MAIKSENVSSREQSKNLTGLERVEIWVHEHPTTTKILKVATLILGVGLLASLPFTAPILGTGLVVGPALLTLACSVALFALDFIVSPHHDMKDHVYTIKQCDGGQLYYEGDVPVLSLEYDDFFKAGKAHGYLCGDAINRLSERFELMQPRADQLLNTLAEIRQRIPPDYLKEMEGLMEGYNQWVEEKKRDKKQYWWQAPKKLTLNDVLLFHLIPDSLHFDAKAYENRLPKTTTPQLTVACSAIVERDPQNGFVFARNMDWPSFGVAGTYSLVIHRKHSSSSGFHSTIEVGFPGFVGTLTGMNNQYLSVAMNVCDGKTKKVNGMPASLYNRACLEGCHTVAAVKSFIGQQSPLGSYHLTVVDQTEASSIHFYQALDNTHYTRSWQETEPLVTLNYRYTPLFLTHSINNSIERRKVLNKYFKNKAKGSSLKEALSLSEVNSFITTQSVLMIPKTGEFMVAFDNGFAANSPFATLDGKKLFEGQTDVVA